MDNEKQVEPKPRISVDYGEGRWSKTFHIFDLDKREVVLKEKDATYIAKSILKITSGKSDKGDE
jgi:hypothetical protein